MIWANFFHLYQPAGQYKDVLNQVTIQSYRPLVKILLDHPNARLTLNVTGALLEDFEKNDLSDVTDGLRELGRRGQIEFTGSAKFHAFLPFLSDSEIERQIIANEESLKHYLGEGFVKKGFFPPEMGYEERIGRIVERLGYEWMILDEVSLTANSVSVDYSKVNILAGGNLKVVFRERRLSNLIMSALVRTTESFEEVMKDDLHNDERYFLTGMDGETFGHHRPGLEKVLSSLFELPMITFLQITDVINRFPVGESVAPIASTWASSISDIEKNVQFISWNDPSNQLHLWQKELFDLAFNVFSRVDKRDASRFPELRNKMDEAEASDHFWWASAKPWWSMEMIEQGSFRLMQIVKTSGVASESEIGTASELYLKIVSTAFEWQRSGKIRQMASERDSNLKIPFKERTLEVGGEKEAIYRAFIDMMKDLEKKAVSRGEYEMAIFWRDAVFKIENKSDIYDVIHAVDVLRTKIPNEEVEKMLDKYTEIYRKIRGGQPEQR